MLAVGREDVVLRLAGPAGTDLGCFLARERDPQGELALPLQGGGLPHRSGGSSPCRHRSRAGCLDPASPHTPRSTGSEPRVPSGSSSCTIGSAGAPSWASASASSWSSMPVPSNSVAGRCVAPIPSPCLPHPNAPQSLGYMPNGEYIPNSAYILAYSSLLYPPGRPERVMLSARNAVVVLYRSHRAPGNGCWLPFRRC